MLKWRVLIDTTLFLLNSAISRMYFVPFCYIHTKRNIAIMLLISLLFCLYIRLSAYISNIFTEEFAIRSGTEEAYYKSLYINQIY